MRVILAGGGTGGHIYPALTLAREFRKRDPQIEILFVGGKRGLESDVVPKEGYRLITLNLESIPRRLSPKVIKALWLAGKGVGQTFQIIRQFHPDLVIGTGGYTCGPMVLAASLMGVPTAIQEQNVYPGLTNRILGKFVKRIFLADPEAIKYFPKKKVSVPGNPIRSDEFNSISRPEAEVKLGLESGRLNLLVFGGSLSARRINQSLLGILGRLFQEYPLLQVILVTGPKDFEQIKTTVTGLNLAPAFMNRLKLVPYFYKIAEAFQVTDLVVARAGAISLAEITCFGIPAILIPYPYAAGNHQEYNARVLERRGAARVILDAELDPESLWQNLALLLSDSKLRNKMAAASLCLARPQAAAEIVTELMALV